jgi:hypothetical protein
MVQRSSFIVSLGYTPQDVLPLDPTVTGVTESRMLDVACGSPARGICGPLLQQFWPTISSLFVRLAG